MRIKICPRTDLTRHIFDFLGGTQCHAVVAGHLLQPSWQEGSESQAHCLAHGSNGKLLPDSKPSWHKVLGQHHYSGKLEHSTMPG